MTSPLGLSPCATDTPPCREFLVAQMAEMGVDAVASSARPIIPSTYGVTSFICPHGIEYFLEPTGDQIAAWARDGVR